MPLSEQERRCVDHTCEFLSSNYGGQWRIENCLDEINPSNPSPEAVVTNGDTTAAIEVKRLMGDTIDREYYESLLSNQDYLVPSCGGYYWLSGPVDLRLPLNRKLRRLVKKGRSVEYLVPQKVAEFIKSKGIYL